MSDEVKMIPIDVIRILNPRHRERKKFEVIVQSIRKLRFEKTDSGESSFGTDEAAERGL